MDSLPIIQERKSVEARYSRKEDEGKAVLQVQAFLPQTFPQINTPCAQKIKQITNSSQDCVKDEESMRAFMDSIGILTQLLGCSAPAAKAVPFLNIISAPFYLYHAVKETDDRIELLNLSIKTGAVSKAIFWAGRSIDAIGTAISDIVQPFAGGAQLLGLTKISGIGYLFNLAIPIVLIVFGAIGCLSEAWAMSKTIKALKKFNEECGKQDGSLAKLFSTIEKLSEKETSQGKLQEKEELEKREFEETYFSSEKSQKTIQARAQEIVLEHNRLTQQLHSKLQELLLNENSAEGRINEGSFAHELVSSNLEELEALYVNLIEKFKTTGTPISLEENLKELRDIKQALLEKGSDLLEMERSDLHRKMCFHIFIILMSVMTFASGILYLIDSQSKMAMWLGISSSLLDIALISSNKSISPERFYTWHRYLKSSASQLSLRFGPALHNREAKLI